MKYKCQTSISVSRSRDDNKWSKSVSSISEVEAISSISEVESVSLSKSVNKYKRPSGISDFKYKWKRYRVGV